MWKNPPLMLNFDVYLYNWTNPCNLTADDYEKPILEQIGPYRFREKAMKTKVKWHQNNSTISYRRKSTYYFVEEESIGRMDDKIITINAVAVVSDLRFYYYCYDIFIFYVSTCLIKCDE